MVSLNQIFSNQKNTKRIDKVEEVPIILFQHGSKFLAVPIEQVKQILETANIQPYPEKIKGHRGIVNIRGQIYPVLELVDQLDQDSLKHIIMLELTDKNHFCLEVSQVLKAKVAASSVVDGGVINYEETPYVLMNNNYITHCLGEQNEHSA